MTLPHRSLKFLCCLIALWMALAARAADTYDMSRGTLSAPLVRVGDTYYANVELVLASVVSVGTAGGTPASHDTYDPATNRLSIPVVNVGAATYYQVVASVARVLRVGSTCPTLTACTESDLGSPAQALQVNQLPGIRIAAVNMNTASGYLGNDVLFYNLVGKGDINGDGYEDLVIGLFRHTTSPSYSGREYDPSGEIRPIVLFYNPVSDTYEVNAQLQSVLRKTQHPRQLAIADFDGDGRNDLFIADHGYDDAPFGAQNILVLNKASGFVDGTSLLPQVADFSHGLVMADFDGNGRPDLLVLNNRVDSRTKCELYPGFTECSYNPPKLSESYVLFNHGAAGLAKGSLAIPDDVINFTTTTADMDQRLYVGHSADFNRDGVADLVVSNHRRLYILESTGTGKYATAQVFTPPAAAQAACNDYIPYTAITSTDLDGDGSAEIIASFGCRLTGAEFQVFKRASSGTWSDATATFVGDQSANTALSDGWCYKFELADVNYDGQRDVICQSVRGLGTPSNNVFWWGGQTLQWSGITLQDGAWTNFQTVVRQRDGTYLLGFKSQRGQPELSLYRWKIR